jgi:formate/nitrite transporter FocA (FNT family)
MRVLLWALCFLGALLGALWFFAVMILASGAPQEAAGAAQSVGLAVIPYVLARAWDEASRPTERAQKS